MEPVSLTIVALIVALAVVLWAAVAMWNAHVTERDANRRKAHEVWQVINAAFDTGSDVTLWEDCRSQLEGASVTREG